MTAKALQWVAFAIAILLSVAVLIAWYAIDIPESTTLKVACVGDSITEGSRYTIELSQLLGSDYSVGNFGVGLATVNLASIKPYMNQSVFTQAKDYKPDVVVILLGTNDANPIYQPYLGNFTSDYKALIAAFQTLDSQPKIYLVVPPPIFSDSLGPASSQLTQEVIPKIRQVANETGLPLIDFYAEFESHREYSSDGVHLTFEGSRFVAERIFEGI